MPWGNHGPYFFKLVINPADEAYDDALAFGRYLQVECSILTYIDLSCEIREIRTDGSVGRYLGRWAHAGPYIETTYDESRGFWHDSLKEKNEGCWVKIGGSLRRIKKGEYQALCDEFRSFLISGFTKRL